MSFNRVYKNVMNMMYDRGMEESESYLVELDKIDDKSFIDNPVFHNIGFKIDSIPFKSDLKDIEDRMMMSFSLKDDLRKIKQYVFFGKRGKSFLEHITTIILKNNDKEYTNYYTIVTNIDFSSKEKSKLAVMEDNKILITTFVDEELMKLPFHAYGAKYELMQDEELAIFMKDLHITRKEMKKISHTDPIIKYLGFARGKCVRLIQTPMIIGSLVQTSLDYRMIE